MRAEEAVDRLLQGIERLEGRLEKIEGRLGILESKPPPEEAPPAVARPAPEERPDPFLPAVVRAPASRHMQAVSRALSMLGLVPEPEEEQRNSTKYKAAMQHALEALRATGSPAAGATPVPAVPAAPAAPAAPEAPPAPEPPVLEIAREVALPDAPPEPQAPGMFRGALRRAKAAAARLAGRAPAEAPPPEGPPVAEPALLAAPAPAVVPPPEVVASGWAAEKAERPEAREVDLGTALQIDLERPKTHVRDYAAPMLNALVLLAAAGGALYAGGAITNAGPARDAWPEILAGLAAAGCGAGAWFWRSASTHLRALLAGFSALLLNMVLLVTLPRLGFPDVLLATACGLVSFLGLRVVLETRHPFALFLGFGLALLLPHWLAPLSPHAALRMPFVAAINVATVYGALRLHRLQASAAAATLTAPLLAGASGPLAAQCGAICAASYLAGALLSPLVLRRRSLSAAALVVFGLAFAAWSVHVPCEGPGWLKAAILFAVASAAALVAARLPSRHELLKGVFKAGALLLLLAALPAGLEGGSLAPGTLFLSLLFAIFALVLRDAFLRAAGALMLVVTVGLFWREGGAPPLLFAAAAVAATLSAANPDGPAPRLLILLLGGAAHGLFLTGLAQVVPLPYLASAWAAAALAQQVAARRFPARFLEAGAVAAAGAAAILGLAHSDPLALLASTAAFAPLALLSPSARDLRLLAGGVVAVAAAAVAWPGPAGLLLSLPLLALLLLPWQRARAPGRVLALVLLARSLAPDVLFAPGDAKTFAMGACAVAAVLAARGSRALRVPALLLVAAAAGAWVYARTGREEWSIWAAAVALAAGFVAALPKSKRPAPAPEAEPAAPTPQP